jgi:glycine oxidase
MSGRPDVLVVGGGVLGLSVAYQLAGEGHAVRVLDRGPVERTASWTGAGMIPPPMATPPPDPLERLRDLGARMHADWALALREATGIDNGHRTCGGVDVALDQPEAAELRRAEEAWRSAGVDHEVLDHRRIAEVEPALAPGLARAVLLPGRAQIRNPWHLRALAAGCAARGVDLRCGSAVESLVDLGAGRVGVDVGDRVEEAAEVVVAAGTWSGGLLAGIAPSVATPPVRGQIVLLRTPPGTLRRIVEHGHRYLVPRDDGRVLVGSTEEHAGFDDRPTAAAARTLLDEALRLCPVLADAEPERTWAGLRPGSPDGRPTIGRVPGRSNLIVATGHFRAGLQLSPATAAVVADLVARRPPRIPLDTLAPGRRPSPPPGLFRS